MLRVRPLVVVSGMLVALAAACSGSDDASPPAGTGSSGDSTSSSGSTGSSSSSGSSGNVDTDGGLEDAGFKCTNDDQCEGKCAGGACTTPTTADGKRSPSLGETDVDCGGPTAPVCVDGKTCAKDDDCSSNVCSASRKCVPSPSCRGTNGTSGSETCGTGEPGEPGAVVESCCKSLPLPTTTNRRLDKYEITAGRIREFITALAAANGGEPNVRAFAKAHASAKPNSELGKVASGFPGLLDVLPSNKSPGSALPIQVHLGAFPLDPINTLDGCFVGPNAYGHATYWQPPEDLKPFGVGYPSNNPDGVRKHSRETLDAKPMNCVMPLLLAAFCAWDGGELARTSDYREVWGQQSAQVGAATVFHPWSQLLSLGQFNWRNGHGAACPIAGWPGCQNPQPTFYTFPTGGLAANDDTPAIGAPGRFPLDVTTRKSANGEGWFDVGGNLMEAAWPNTKLNGTVTNVCDATTTTGGTACSRPSTGANGVIRFAGNLPQITLVGYSFEGHARRSEAYLASSTDDETKLPAGDIKPVTFQYGKVGGRCARPGL